MSITLMAMVFAIKGQLTPTEKLVMLELSDHANDRGSGIWPGYETIMARTSLGRTAVRETLEILTMAEVLETIEEPTYTTSTKRQINVSLLEELVRMGEQDELHPGLVEARRIMAEKRQKMKEGGTPKDTGEGRQKTQGGSPEDTGEGRSKTQGGSPEDTGEGRSKTQGGSPEDTESLFKHPLNITKPPEKPAPQAVKVNPLEIWENVASQLRMEMKTSGFETWILPLKPDRLEGEVFVINTANAYCRDWVQSRLSKRIEGLLSPLIGQPVKLRIEVHA
jgi:hypothetical protein